MDAQKHHHLIIDIVIGILIIIILLLIDLFVVSFRSLSGEVREEALGKGGEGIEGEEGGEVITDVDKIQSGEYVFIPIFNFHHIKEAPPEADEITMSYYVSPARFEEIVKSLVDNGYQTVFVSEIVNMLQAGDKPKDKIMAITFDDGNLDYYTNARPILQKYNLKSSLYIMTGVRGEDFLSQDQIVELDKSGEVEIGSHTVYHPFLTKISTEEMDKELAGSKKQLEDLLGKEITVICYPFGFYDENVINAAQTAGYQAGLTFDQDAWQNSQELMALKRISVYPEMNVVKFLERLEKEK